MGIGKPERRLTAILAADIVGYSKLMGEDEVGTLSAYSQLKDDSIRPLITEYGGRIVNIAGDSVLAEFVSVVDATACAVAWQEKTDTNGESASLQFRIGINLGDVLVHEGEIYGNGVNVAARMEALAEPGGICISKTVYNEIKNKIDLNFDYLGEQTVKNIAEPISVYKIICNTTPKLSEESLEASLSLPDKPSIAVLPFDNMSDDPEQEFLADGFAEAITAALSRFGSFFVIARNTAFTFKGQPINIQKVGVELGVAYILEGSVQRAGNRLRVTVQLVETVGGSHLWADTYDGMVEDIFDLQDRITEQVVGALQPSIRQAEIVKSRRKRPQDLGAYDYTMRALAHVWLLEKNEAEKALVLLEKALDIDPNYPLALALAGWCSAQQVVYNWTVDPVASLGKALELAEHASNTVDDDPLTLTVLGTIRTIALEKEHARVLLERAVAIDPNFAWGWSRLGWLEAYECNVDTAEQHLHHALRLSPLDPMNFNTYAGLGAARACGGDYETAVQHFRRALTERPGAHWIRRILTVSLMGAGQEDEAREMAAELLLHQPDFTIRSYMAVMPMRPHVKAKFGTLLRALGLPEG